MKVWEPPKMGNCRSFSLSCWSTALIIGLFQSAYVQVGRSQQWFYVFTCQVLEHKNDSKLGKEYIKAVYWHPAHLIYVQSTSWKMLGWMKHELESRLSGEISITSDMQMTPPLRQKGKKNERASWWKWKMKVKMLAWSSTFRKRRSWHLVPSLHGK